MISSRIILLAFLAAFLTSACVDWQAGYDHAARSDCLDNPDDSRRRACLEAVDRNSEARRAQQREARRPPNAER